MTRTHTTAILDVPATAYAAIRALLVGAGYEHVFRMDTGRELADLHGISLRAKPGAVVGAVTVSTLLSSRTKEGRVELALNGETTQMELDKAREIVGMLQQAIEAAISDQVLYAFLTTKVGLDDERASRALLDFRELRQGTRGLSTPS